MARRVRFPRAVAIATCGASLAIGVIVSTPPAAANTRAQQVKSQIAAAQRQLRSLNNQAEIASERYNAARIKLQAAQQTAGIAQRRLSTAKAALAHYQASVTAFAVAAYRGNTQDSMLGISTGTTAQYLGRAASMQAISASEAQTIASAAAAQRGEEQAQVDATAALSAQRSATSALAADRRQIVAAAAKERTILAHLEAKERAIIREARQRAAREAARRAAARLAAQRAAAAAAAHAVVTQPVSQPAPVVQPAPHVSAAGGAATAVAWAYQEIGKPYVWGAAGPNSFDCSGLAQYVWGKAGVYLAHFTGDQWNEGTHVARSQLEPGDLVFFATNTSEPSTIHHVGIYVGGGMMIDAPYTGVDVRKEPAFRSDYIGAVRPG